MIDPFKDEYKEIYSNIEKAIEGKSMEYSLKAIEDILYNIIYSSHGEEKDICLEKILYMYFRFRNNFSLSGLNKIG